MIIGGPFGGIRWAGATDAHGGALIRTHGTGVPDDLARETAGRRPGAGASSVSSAAISGSRELYAQHQGGSHMDAEKGQISDSVKDTIDDAKEKLRN